MAIVTLESNDGREKVTVEAREGGALVDICDDHRAPIPFSCRSASCATCHIEVLEGESALLPPDQDELDVLDVVGMAPPRFRLACCAKVAAGDAPVRIRAMNEY